jgi:hypothetical protein
MGEVRLAAPVKAQYIADLFNHRNPPAGAFTYYTVADERKKADDPTAEKRGIIYTCPCGCGRQGVLPFEPKTTDDIKYKRATWTWDKNVEAPTLTPSINHVGHWHGHLTGGMFTQA